MRKVRNWIILFTALTAVLSFTAGPVFAQGFTIDFSSAEGFGVSGEPEQLQTNNVIINLNVTNPLTGEVLTTTIRANVVWQFDYSLIALTLANAQAANPPANTCDALPSLTVNVTHALTGAAIEGATVQASGESGQTESSGAVTLTGLPVSSMPVSVSATGFVSSTQTVTLECGDQESIGVALLPEDDPGTIAGDIRIILTWGENPRDLDSHLTMYDDAGDQQFHIYYNNTNNSSGSPSNPAIPAWLDVDDQYSYGPETITIFKVAAGARRADGSFVPGTYYYSIHQYAGSSNIPASGATIKVYQGDTLMGTFTTPDPGNNNVADNWVLRALKIVINDNGDVSFSSIGEYYGPVYASQVEK